MSCRGRAGPQLWSSSPVNANQYVTEAGRAASRQQAYAAGRPRRPPVRLSHAAIDARVSHLEMLWIEKCGMTISISDLLQRQIHITAVVPVLHLLLDKLEVDRAILHRPIHPRCRTFCSRRIKSCIH